MDFTTHHMVDEERMETIISRQVFARPMRGSTQAIEDAALAVYMEAYENGGPVEAKRAWEEVWKNTISKS